MSTQSYSQSGFLLAVDTPMNAESEFLLPLPVRWGEGFIQCSMFLPSQTLDFRLQTLDFNLPPTMKSALSAPHASVKKNGSLRPHSSIVLDGPERAPSRAMLYP